MKYNKDLLMEKLIAHEGLRLQVYEDSLGIATIGIGRNLEDRGITPEELEWMDIPNMAIVHTMGITEADAMYLAQNDVQIVEEELLRAHPCVDRLDAVRQLVLVDMAFNLGVPRLSKFKKMWAAIHEEKFDVAAKEMLDSRWANQVKSRSTKLAHAMHHGEFND
jgi:lysozyme